MLRKKRTFELFRAIIILLAVIWKPVTVLSTHKSYCPVITPQESKIMIGDRIFMENGNNITSSGTTPDSCLQCHDGTIAPGILFNEPTSINHSSTINKKHMSVNNHPVDVLYPQNNREYINLGQLDNRLVLTDGKITCFTCHSGDWGTKNLSLSNERGGLCLSCHIK